MPVVSYRIGILYITTGNSPFAMLHTIQFYRINKIWVYLHRTKETKNDGDIAELWHSKSAFFLVGLLCCSVGIRESEKGIKPRTKLSCWTLVRRNVGPPFVFNPHWLPRWGVGQMWAWSQPSPCAVGVYTESLFTISTMRLWLLQCREESYPSMI